MGTGAPRPTDGASARPVYLFRAAPLGMLYAGLLLGGSSLGPSPEPRWLVAGASGAFVTAVWILLARVPRVRATPLESLGGLALEWLAAVAFGLMIAGPFLGLGWLLSRL